MEYFVNCNTSTLAPYVTPLDSNTAAHLYRRLGLSASVQTIQTVAVGQTATSLVDILILEAQNMAPLPPPVWANWNGSNYPADEEAANSIIQAQRAEWREAYATAIFNNTLRDRLSFFWHNHFVTELDVYDCNPFLYHYINCLQRNAIGNFKTFVHEIGLTDAMLYYLDGAYNNGDEPNENYARELYELFTLGEGNAYTEQDIVDTAAALSGYTERGEIGCEPVQFDATTHDPGPKTILGQTGNWGYDDVIDILFQERPNEIARFICTKFYEFFVHPDSKQEDMNLGSYPAGHPQGIINELAATFVANNFEIAPVLAQLFKSQHFFDDEAIGVILKSPYDLYYNFMNETSFAFTQNTNINTFINYTGLLGQELFEPVDVAGWQRDRQWINTNFIIGRWLTMEAIIDDLFASDPEQFRTFAMDAVGPANSGTSNPEIVVTAIIDKITPKGMYDQQQFDNAMSAFLITDVPLSYYSPDFTPDGTNQWMLNISMSSPQQVYLLIRHLSRQPEFQLK